MWFKIVLEGMKMQQTIVKFLLSHCMLVLLFCYFLFF